MRNIVLRLLGLTYRLLKRTPLIHIPFAKWLYYRIYSLNHPPKLMEIEVEGSRLWIDPADQGFSSFLLTTGTYEPYEVSIVKQLLRPDACFVDIGANIGYYTILASRNVGARGQVYAFEPYPDNFNLLLRNIEANGFASRVNAHQCAIGDATGKCEMFLSSENHGDHRIVPDPNRQRATIEVHMRTLDEMIDPQVAVDVIKMDIQGSEFLALAGMQRVLEDNPDLVIAMEFWPDGITQTGHDPQAILQLARRWNFTVHLIDEQRQKLRTLNEGEILERCRSKGEYNMLLTRGRSKQLLANFPQANIARR